MGGNETLVAEALRPIASFRNNTVLKLLIPVAMLAIGARIFFAKLVLPDGLCDDGYTTLRYAANVAQGHGFVFNIGEPPVWGTTTPLFTLILAVTAKVFGVSVLETAAVVLGIAGYTVFWFLLLRIFEESRVPRLISLPVVLLTMIGPAFFENSISGMETPLVLALMAGSYLCYMKDRPIGLGVLFALLLLARIDTLVWIGIVGVAYILRHYKENAKQVLVAVAAFVLVSLPWHLYALITFHSLIPQTVVAKAATNNVAHLSHWAYIVEEFCRVYFPGGPIITTLPASLGVAVVISLMAILIVGATAIWRQHPTLRPLAIFWFAFNACFIGAKVQPFSWYLPPTQWLAFFLLFAGLYAVWNRWLAIYKTALPPQPSPAQDHRAASAARLARGGLQLTPWCLVFIVLASHCIRGTYRLYQDCLRDSPWVELADFIRDQTSESDRVFLEHIGLVGFRSNRLILDNIGLVSPDFVELRKQYPQTWIPVSLRRHHEPEVVVLYRAQRPEYSDFQLWSDLIIQPGLLLRLANLKRLSDLDLGGYPDEVDALWPQVDREWFAKRYQLVKTVPFAGNRANYVYVTRTNLRPGVGQAFQPDATHPTVPVVRH
jgi:hypothetical protein